VRGSFLPHAGDRAPINNSARAVRPDIRGVLRAREIAVVKDFRIGCERSLGVGGRRVRKCEYCGGQ
jgi:hypothetical protein